MTKISVIMPIRNSNNEYLKESVESILNQTYSDFELLIIDDSDNNDNKNFLKSYNDTRIIVIEGNRKGLASALNKGISHAEGEYIARMDADDISMPERFSKQVEYLDNHPEISVLGTNFQSFPQIKEFIYPQSPDYFDIIQGCCIGHPTVMMRLSDIKKYNLYYNEDFKFSEDYELWSRAVRYTNIANLQEILLKYRIVKGAFRANLDTVEKYDRKIESDMISFLTKNKKYQKIIYRLLKKKHYTFLQRLFSINNERKYEKKWKVIQILGLKIKIRGKA